MDSHENIAGLSQVCAVLLGNLETRDYELVDVSTVPLPADIAAGFHVRKLGYCGVLGIVGKQFRSAFAVPLDNATVDAIAASFIEFCVTKLTTPVPTTKPDARDSVQWLHDLFAIPDDRDTSKEN